MRDLHYDGSFANDFNKASKNWSWATWHEVRAAEDATARRLLEDVFGPANGESAPTADNSDDSGE